MDGSKINKNTYFFDNTLFLDDVLVVKLFNLISIQLMKIFVRVDCEESILDKAIDFLVLESPFDILKYLWLIDDVNVHQVVSFLIVLLLKRIALVYVYPLALNNFALLVFATYYVLSDRRDDSLFVK